MAKTLLNAVNETLKRVNEIAGDAGLLTTLTDSARQHPVDIAVQVVNEGVIDLYSVSQIAQPNEQAESAITLVTSTRAYALASDLVALRWPFIDKTNNQYLTQYPGGYNAMLVGDPEQDDTGLPYYAAIRPTDGYLHLDRAPTSVENGRIYTYQYDKSLIMSAAASTVPFTDEVFTMMVPVWTQLWKREMRNEFDDGLYMKNLGVASKLLTRVQPITSYSPR
jgi:hypothetical protein